MDTYVIGEYMENTFIVFCIRNGSLFCHKKKELETIIAGEGEADFFTLSVWNFFHCSNTPFSMAKVLWPGYKIFSGSGPSMVSGKHLYLCDIVISIIFLFKKK